MVFQIERGRESESEEKGGGPKGGGVLEVAQDGVPNQVQCSETVSLCSVLFFFGDVCLEQEVIGS